MKKLLITLVSFYILLTFGGALIGVPIFKVFMGGGASEEFLYPLYWGIMLLGGLIVVCTQIIIEQIKQYKVH